MRLARDVLRAARGYLRGARDPQLRPAGLRGPLRRRRGFSLIEALAAFAILALVMGQLLAGVSGGARNESRADFLMRASRQGMSQLEALGADGALAPGVFEGRYDDGLLWRLTVVARDALRGANGAPSAVAYGVQLVIARPSGDSPLTLSTVKLVSVAGRPQ